MLSRRPSAGRRKYRRAGHRRLPAVMTGRWRADAPTDSASTRTPSAARSTVDQDGLRRFLGRFGGLRREREDCFPGRTFCRGSSWFF